MPPRISVKDSHDNEANAGGKNKNDADDEHSKSWHRSWKSASPLTKLNIWLTGVIAMSTLTYASFAGWQLIELSKSVQIAHDAFVAANRPYVGPEGISLTYLRKDTAGNTALSNLPTADAYEVDFGAGIKNFGNVPATNVRISWDVRLDGSPVQETKIPDSPYTMYPTQSTTLPGAISIAIYNTLRRGEKTLVVKVFCDYDGPNGHYHECEKYQFARDRNGFYTLGACE